MLYLFVITVIHMNITGVVLSALSFFYVNYFIFFCGEYSCRHIITLQALYIRFTEVRVLLRLANRELT